MNIIITSPCSQELKIKVEQVNTCVDNNPQMYEYFYNDMLSVLKDNMFVWKYPSGKLRCVPAGNPIINSNIHVELPNISISYMKEGNILIEL